MASPGPPPRSMKRLRKARDVPEEQDGDVAPAEDADARQGSRRHASRAPTARNDAEQGEAGPSNAQQQAPGQEQVRGLEDELAHMVRQRDHYKAEAENATEPSVSREEREQVVAAIMRHMLFRQQQKVDQPVRRDELTKVVQGFGKKGGGGNLATYAIAHAQARFATIFGMELKCIEVMPASRAGGKSSKGDAQPYKAYVLRSLLPAVMRTTFVHAESADPSQAFALVVISILNLHGGTISEEDLWRYLEGLAVQQKQPHPVLGLPEQQLELMLKKRYIVESKAGNSDGKRYAAGENALDEISSEDVKAFINMALEAPGDDPIVLS